MIRVWVDCSDGSTIEVISGGLDDEAHPIGADGTQIVENLWVKHTLTAALVAFTAALVALQLHSLWTIPTAAVS